MVNTDYTFNGEPISESFVIEAAEVEGLSVDEYVNQKEGLKIVEVTDEIQEPVTEGKTSDVATVDAGVTSEPDTASENTESDSVDTSGDLQLFGNYKDAIKLTAEEQAVLDNPIDFTPSGITRELQPYNPDTGEVEGTPYQVERNGEMKTMYRPNQKAIDRARQYIQSGQIIGYDNPDDADSDRGIFYPQITEKS